MQVGAQAAPSTPRTNVVEMGRYLAQNGISVEQARHYGTFTPREYLVTTDCLVEGAGFSLAGIS